MTSAEQTGYRVQLVGGRHDGDTAEIIKVIPRITVKAPSGKMDDYILTQSYSKSGELLYVHENMVTAWRQWRKC